MTLRSASRLVLAALGCGTLGSTAGCTPVAPSTGQGVAPSGGQVLAVVVRSDYIPRIQEVQASVYHVLRGLLEELRKG